MIARLLEWLRGLIDIALSWLPPSPFAPIAEAIAGLEWLGWLNWFIPVGKIAQLTLAWTVAIGLYYAATILLRWVKAIR